MREAVIAPTNSILFISDVDGGETPEITRGSPIWKTSTCIAFATYPEQDGDTRLLLGNIAEVDPGRAPDMDTMIETPKLGMIVETAVQEVIFEVSVPNRTSRIVIWLSHQQWPDEVRIGVG